MRILITNDDGIDSAGLVPLAHAALRIADEVIVAAPNREYSAFSAALRGDGDRE
ncbi:MAG: 5'/3'-nucleotidase SurE, partial [Beutenbergiaceae bacterium]